MSTDAPIAESSPAAETFAPLPKLADLSPTERETWDLTGELPGVNPYGSSTAESTPAEPAAQAASTDAQTEAASEPAAPGKKNAETRVQELLRERHEQNQRIAELERRLQPAAPKTDEPPAASSPASVASDPFPEYDAWLKQAGNEAGTYEAYLDARTDHRWQQKEAAQQAAQQQTRAQQEGRQRMAAFIERRDAAIAADPSFLEVLSDDVRAIEPIDGLPPGAPIGPLNVAAQEIVQSPLAPQIMRHLSTHPDEFNALRTATPAQVVRAIAKLEAKLEASTPGSPAAAAPPSPPPITKAPDPPPTLGVRPAAPTNEADAAVARGDFKAYEAAMNRLETAGA